MHESAYEGILYILRLLNANELRLYFHIKENILYIIYKF